MNYGSDTYEETPKMGIGDYFALVVFVAVSFVGIVALWLSV